MAIAQDNGVATDPDDRTKPPFLRRVRIQGYKSIAFCDVALQPLTILVGRNASGKSNFLDALAFLRDMLMGGIDKAVRIHGGRKAILPRWTNGSTVSFGLEIGYEDDVNHDLYVAEYSITFRLASGSKTTVRSERFRLQDDTGNIIKGFDRKNDSVKMTSEGGSSHRFDFGLLDGLMLAGVGRTEPADGAVRGLEGMSFYNFYPDAIRKLQIPLPGTRLEPNGRNLASVIETLHSIDEETFHRVVEYLSAIVTEIEGFKVVNYGEYETVRFQLCSSHKKKSKRLEFDAAGMSDGTLRALAAIVAAFQIQLPSGPSVVGIEEPETSLHPAAMRSLVDAMDEATGRTQVLLTTHSADLLDDRDLHPSQILVVRNRDGQTLITPVDSASREIIAKELDTLADLHRQDHLDLDEADLQRQASERTGNGGA